MKSHELARQLLSMPDVDVEINDNNGGEVYVIEQVDHFPADDEVPDLIIIQVNC